MGNTGFTGSEQINLGTVEFDTMRMPDVGTGPTKIFGILSRTTAKICLRIGNIFSVLGQMGMQHHTLIPRQKCGITHQVATD